MPSAWLLWWSILCAATVMNIAAWGFSAYLLGRRKNYIPADVYDMRRRLLSLAAIYVLGCGFRSVLPMVDLPRICLHDTWFSRIVVGRSVASVAELCFAAQWALLLRDAGAGGGLATAMSRAVLPLIVAAELFSWSAALKTNYLLHAVENSLWTLTAALVIAGFLSAWPHVDARSRRVIAAAAVCGAGYLVFMTTVDVPMYLSRWQAQLAAGQEYLSLRDGMREVLQRCVVTREWAAWRDDVPWLSLYFTIAVWISIALAHVPPVRRTNRRGRP